MVGEVHEPVTGLEHRLLAVQRPVVSRDGRVDAGTGDGPGLSHLMREHIRGKKPVIAANFGEAAAELPADAAG